MASGFAAPKSWGMFGGTMATAVVAGTVSQTTGGKFVNGAISGSFVHMFNSLASTIGGQAANKGTKAGLEQADVNKSMANILAQGAGGMISGAIGGFFAAGPLGGFVGAFVGGTFGTAMGLTTGATLESAGVYDTIDTTIQKVKDYIFRRPEE